jgi:hypothetical protein
MTTSTRVTYCKQSRSKDEEEDVAFPFLARSGQAEHSTSPEQLVAIDAGANSQS